MPSNVKTTPPDQATGLRHVGEPANAILARINATRPPNVVKMHDAIDEWVIEARRRGGQAGIEYLHRCGARVENSRRNHEDHALGRAKLIDRNIGLGPMDFSAAASRIARAIASLQEEAGRHPWMTDAERAACEA